ncbi:MAG TPA: class I SAM-dependent methyltransferase [Tepidisphaeraceae bacterium]|nr:class I SAM-dependent methyltransferase [Tepidisphaeraceae bacterium]
MSKLRTIKMSLKIRFPRLYEGVKACIPATRRQERALMGRSAQEVFTSIYQNKGWRSAESASGDGSTLEFTQPLRGALPGFLAELGVRVFLDAPCGDFNWMRRVHLGVDRYIGADIVPEMIERLQREYANDSRSFFVLNILSEPLPEADALFCRDCLRHLSLNDVSAVLKNAKRSRCRYFIASTCAKVKLNIDIATGGSRPLNLCLPPFNLPPPIKEINDGDGGPERRTMGVWRIDQL